MEHGCQAKKRAVAASGRAKRPELVIPNPKLKLLDQVREVLRVKHYAIRTEQAYCDWIRRYVRFQGHNDVSTTMIYTHVLRQGGSGMKSPLDCL